MQKELQSQTDAHVAKMKCVAGRRNSCRHFLRVCVSPLLQCAIPRRECGLGAGLRALPWCRSLSTSAALSPARCCCRCRRRRRRRLGLLLFLPLLVVAPACRTEFAANHADVEDMLVKVVLDVQLTLHETLKKGSDFVR